MAQIKVLIVIAHPDDESAMAATVYKITKEMRGIVDLIVITNGEGGYKYSTLAESYYGLELTNEHTARENLPSIRKKEMMNAAAVLGIRNIFFLDQKDAYYSSGENEPMDTSWDTGFVYHRIRQVMMQNNYDLVFTLLPHPGAEPGHKAATLLTLRSVVSLPDPIQRPAILGVTVGMRSDTGILRFSQYRDYIESATIMDTAVFQFDRNNAFGYRNTLNYKIVVNWELAEHKSQGNIQLGANPGDYEKFWFYSINSIASYQKCRNFFERLKFNPYPVKTY